MFWKIVVYVVSFFVHSRNTLDASTVPRRRGFKKRDGNGDGKALRGQ